MHAEADLSLRLAHMSEGTFSHVATRLVLNVINIAKIIAELITYINLYQLTSVRMTSDR